MKMLWIWFRGYNYCKIKGFQTFSDSWFQGFSCFSRCVLFGKRMVSFAMVRSTTNFGLLCVSEVYIFVGSPSVMPHLYAFMWNYRTWQCLTCNACKNHNQKPPLCDQGKQTVTYLKWSGPHFLRLNQSIIGKMENHFLPTRKNHHTFVCRFHFWKTSKPQACDNHISMVSFPSHWRFPPTSKIQAKSPFPVNFARETQIFTNWSEKVVDPSMFLNMFILTWGNGSNLTIFFENVDLYFSKIGWNHHLGRKPALEGAILHFHEFLARKRDRNWGIWRLLQPLDEKYHLT